MLVTSLGPLTDLWWDKSEGKTKWSQRVEQILGWERCDVSTQRHHNGQAPSAVCVLAHNVRKSRLRKRQKGLTFLSGGLMVINHANRRYMFVYLHTDSQSCVSLSTLWVFILPYIRSLKTVLSLLCELHFIFCTQQEKSIPLISPYQRWRPLFIFLWGLTGSTARTLAFMSRRI